MRLMVVRRLFIFLALVVTGAGQAQTKISDVTIGWGDRARPGSWVPIYVTLADPKPRNAVIELYAPHDSSLAMRIRQSIAVGPSEQTYVLYAPLINSYAEPIKLEVRDQLSHKLLAERNLYDQSNPEMPDKSRLLFNNANGNSIFIGVSGRTRALGELSIGGGGPQIGFVRQAFLPRSAKGYDGVNALALNEPDLNALEAEQQNGIADWVRAGGHLVLWPSTDPVPEVGPLIDLLPCRIGDVAALAVTPQQLQQAQLPARFGKLRQRRLEPKPGTVAFSPFNGGKDPVIVRGRAGLGHVTVVSFNPSELQFNQSSNAQIFLGSVFDVTTKGPSISNSWINVRQSSSQIQDDKRAGAAGQVMDLLGDVPGVGTFGFRYVAMVLLGMMVIVGPIDWFVLKKLGRQPWTWVTTTGWIGLITTGAIFIGSVVRSGDLHLRTLRLTEQVEDTVVARTDVVGIYSPRTDDYRLDVRPGSWWEPISTDTYGYGRNVMLGIPFDQNGRDNVPAPTRINVWNLRFLTGETIEHGAPVIAADLTVQSVPGENYAQRLTGTLTNLGDVPLQHVWLRTAKESVDLSERVGFPKDGIAPQASLAIDLTLKNVGSENYWSVDNNQSGRTRYGQYGQPLPLQPRDAMEIAKAAGDLSPTRGRRCDELVSEGAMTHVVIYAESEAPVPAAKLMEHVAMEKHWQVVRAVVSVKHK
jgi:hypothetical protein